VPGGSYFLWLTLNDDVDSALWLRRSGRKVAFISGSDFMLDGGRSSLRLVRRRARPADRRRRRRIAAALEGCAPRPGLSAAHSASNLFLPRRYTPLRNPQ
jgi:hypothetical protein